ncbi:TPA: PGF-CTERM sorting domain-containing protein [Methanosarcina acetivorans]|uniref:PGF-CTERM archaeal protein-sorting signal domain-containing protein n=2 Tax=Methanosarcina acetivorans TaxID=2214 RepID=Q8TQY5_METAC|nr:PGF-CTERM sorting domain-containing protein [Methanosarcina acetivorans]AAM04817.1 hypothetical protein (multi-domain) [Methanosarcina acetivorans C2A]HIH94087.1 PGF-CTERM sorting domain-containing protein [Methanosarcina acetivorans]
MTPEAANSFIPRVWAYTTINSLLDRIEVEGKNEALVSEVTGLALEFGSVTPYTSLFVELPKLADPEPTGAINEEVAEKMVEMEAEEEMALEEEEMPGYSTGQQEPSISLSYDRNGAYDGGLAEGVEEEATPGFGISLALIGLLGIAFCFRKK